MHERFTVFDVTETGAEVVTGVASSAKTGPAKSEAAKVAADESATRRLAII